MLEFLIASSINCAQAQGVIGRIWTNEDLSETIKSDLVEQLVEHSDCSRNANVDWRNALLVYYSLQAELHSCLSQHTVGSNTTPRFQKRSPMLGLTSSRWKTTTILPIVVLSTTGRGQKMYFDLLLTQKKLKKQNEQKQKTFNRFVQAMKKDKFVA